MSRPPLTKTAPTSRLLVGAVFVAVSTSALGGIRTPNLLIRSQMLYPLSYERRSLVVLPAIMQACATLSQQHSVDRAFDSPPATGSCGTCQGYGMAGAVRTGGREEPMSSDATSSASSMREARRVLRLANALTDSAVRPDRVSLASAASCPRVMSNSCCTLAL
jgi:hypothetical protein